MVQNNNGLGSFQDKLRWRQEVDDASLWTVCSEQWGKWVVVSRSAPCCSLLRFTLSATSHLWADGASLGRVKNGHCHQPHIVRVLLVNTQVSRAEVSTDISIGTVRRRRLKQFLVWRCVGGNPPRKGTETPRTQTGWKTTFIAL